VAAQNVEIVGRAFIASSGGDPTAAGEAYDPAIEWDLSGVEGWTEKRVYRGAEVLPFLQSWASSWRDWHFDVDEVQAAPNDRVFAAIHEWAAGVQTGVSVDQRRYFAVDLSKGLITRVRMFSDRTDALKAAGLEQ
jgi:ketosteroid isomerase-like protein